MTNLVSSLTTQMEAVTHLPLSGQATSATHDDDDDHIVWPVTPRAVSASVTLDLPLDTLDDNGPVPIGDSVPLGCNEVDGSSSSSKTNDDRSFVSNHVMDNHLLERGDCGSKVWTPPPSVQRPRRRGHRTTKSESAIPVPFASEEPETVSMTTKGAWADEVQDLEQRMARASIAAPVSQTLQNSEPSPSVQRNRKKQKANRSRLSALNPSRKDSKANTFAAQSYPSPAASPKSDSSTPPANPSPEKKKKKKGGKKPTKAVISQTAPSTAPSTPGGLGTRSIVDDVSENGDALLVPQSLTVYRDVTGHFDMTYEDAVKLMNTFIQHPDYFTSKALRLASLQALIVELGLVSTTGPQNSLPESLTAAKALLKSHVFMNVRDYLAVRDKGIDALRSAMRPSRSALVRELRGRNGRRAKLGWIKDTGLSVLLVSCQY